MNYDFDFPVHTFVKFLWNGIIMIVIDIFINFRELTQTEVKMFEMLKNLLELILSTVQMVQERMLR